ncbi:MAG: sodium:proton exchanger [Bacteroidetes bacterium]|nr:sodium:proton exchanger [Bacteroidota bacterium]
MISHKFNIPSVILLIAVGIGIEIGLKRLGITSNEEFEFIFLEVLGLIGLIMIVLEAALDLKLRKEKKWLLTKAFLVALLIFIISSAGIAFLLTYMLSMDFLTALVYAIPLSIMSSAIIIPSVNNLMEEKKEFMIYESTFSDILGIMAFYMLIGGIESRESGAGTGLIIQELTLTTLLTAVISLVFSYLMVMFFQNVKGHGKLVLMVSILTFLYALGKINHLSPLLLILMFGLILNNKQVFFRGYLKRFIKEDDALSHVLLDEFKVVTIEASFFVRTVFFVLFGMSIALDTLANPLVIAITGMILAVLYFVRYLNLKVFTKTSIYPELFIAPRGLITILLFYAIPEKLQSEQFDSGILLLTIISTALIMMLALMLSGSGDTIDEVEDVIIDPTVRTISSYGPSGMPDANQNRSE